MDRHWLLTSTTYGNWLPGDSRGFVSDLRDDEWTKTIHNMPGTPCDEDEPALQQWCRNQLLGDPVLLNREQAKGLLAQFQETAEYRAWLLMAVAIMRNHFHIVVGVPGDPEPSKLLSDFKSYGSRALNRTFGKPKSDTWWTESGSKRKLPNESAVRAAISYVRNQPYTLVIWIHPDFV